MRAFIFILWQQASESAPASLKLIKTLAKGQYKVVSQGGARVVSADVGGKSFSYELPTGMSAADFQELLRQAYKKLSLGGASGAAMTNAELRTYVLDADDQITNTTRIRFAASPRY